MSPKRIKTSESELPLPSDEVTIGCAVNSGRGTHSKRLRIEQDRSESPTPPPTHTPVVLPPELLAAVLEWAPTSTLVQASLASRFLHRASLPLLYRDVSFFGCDVDSFASFVTTAGLNPTYCGYIRRLEVRSLDTDDVYKDRSWPVVGRSGRVSHTRTLTAFISLLIRVFDNCTSLVDLVWRPISPGLLFPGIINAIAALPRLEKVEALAYFATMPSTEATLPSTQAILPEWKGVMKGLHRRRKVVLVQPSRHMGSLMPELVLAKGDTPSKVEDLALITDLWTRPLPASLFHYLVDGGTQCPLRSLTLAGCSSMAHMKAVLLPLIQALPKNTLESLVVDICSLEGTFYADAAPHLENLRTLKVVPSPVIPFSEFFKELRPLLEKATKLEHLAFVRSVHSAELEPEEEPEAASLRPADVKLFEKVTKLEINGAECDVAMLITLFEGLPQLTELFVRLEEDTTWKDAMRMLKHSIDDAKLEKLHFQEPSNHNLGPAAGLTAKLNRKLAPLTNFPFLKQIGVNQTVWTVGSDDWGRPVAKDISRRDAFLRRRAMATHLRCGC